MESETWVFRPPVSRRCFGTIVLLVIFCSSALKASSLPRIKVLATGGTIAGAQSGAQAPSYKSGAVSIEVLLQTIPHLDKIADVSSEQVCNVGSQTMNNAIWLQLAKRLAEVLQDPNVDGVVITHGTDTLEETAYFLSLVSKSDKPIVIVGAMRPSTALGADGLTLIHI